MVKGKHLHWVGLEDKQLENGITLKAEDQIVRVWNVHKPKKILTENDNELFHVLHDKGRVGIFLKGFLGYNSNPNWVEFLAWFISLIFGLSLWRKFYFTES
jgi:hypothetical protein